MTGKIDKDVALYMLEDILKATDNPPARADFQYGHPMKGHGWQPMPNPEMIRMMADPINKTSPGMVVTR